MQTHVVRKREKNDRTSQKIDLDWFRQAYL